MVSLEDLTVFEEST